MDDNPTPQATDDFAGSLELEAETTETITETPDQPAEAAAGETTETAETPDTPEQPDVPQEGDKAEDTPAETPEQTEARKFASREERAEYFKQLQAQQKQQVQQAIDKVYQPQDLDELKQKYLNQDFNEYEATMMARDEQREQKAQIAEARAEIAELNAGLIADAQTVMNSVPWLNPQSETFDKTAADEAGQLYEQLALTKDPRTGQIIEAKLSPTQFYTLLDKIRTSGLSRVEKKARSAAEAQMASVAPTPSAKPPTTQSPSDKQAADLAAAFDAI